MRVPTPEIGRRRFLAAGAAAASGIVVPRLGIARPALVATPAQMRGPFYPITFPADQDADLVVLRGAEARAQGVVTHIMGRVLGTDAAPIPGATVELWQCDANGRYRRPGDTGRRPRDAAFQGYGRATTGPDGGYRFRTIRPVAYPGRTPHIHFAVRPPSGRALVTQMYVAGEPSNGRDGLYAGLRGARQREAVTVALVPANGIEPAALAGTFDLVLAV